MYCGPDLYSSDDEDGLSDDNDYYEFKQKLKAIRHSAAAEKIESEAEKRKKYLESISWEILAGNINTVVEALNNGLEVDIDLDKGWTPFLLASTVANEKLISILLDKGANIHQTKDDKTALMYLCDIYLNNEATKEKVLRCVKLLLENKVNVNAIDNKRKTAIMSAAFNGHFEVVKLLLPLVDMNAVDNQRWNVFFWAVDGNSKDIVEFLLNQGFSCETVDVRGNTVRDLAECNLRQDILDLFPKDPFNDFYDKLMQKQVDLDTFEALERRKAVFLSDICQILYGCRSEYVLPTLQKEDIDLFQLLSITDAKLQNIGVKFPFQRNRIMGGLYRFHKHPYKPQSIPFVKKDEIYSNIDISKTVVTCVKQVIAMEAALKFILENRDKECDLTRVIEVKTLVRKLKQQISRLKLVSEQFVEKTEQWDSQIKPCDKITKKRRNIPWGNLCLFGFLSIVCVLYKFR